MRKHGYALAFSLLPVLLLTGCASQNSHVMEGGSAVNLRSFQTRAFDTTDKHKMMRTIIAVLQDLGFIIDKTDEDLGIDYRHQIERLPDSHDRHCPAQGREAVGGKGERHLQRQAD